MYLYILQVKIWFQNRRMKWKRSKKAQQEAKAKAAADRAAKLNGTKLNSSNSTTSAGGPTPENKSKRITEEDELLMSGSEDHEDEDIDVGEDSDPCMASPQGAPSSIMPPAASTPNLITPTPILGLPHPPALQLRPLLAPPSMIRPPPASALGMDLPLVDPTSTSLSALLPAHLARLSQAATGGNRLYRPFVA